MVECSRKGLGDGYWTNSSSGHHISSYQYDDCCNYSWLISYKISIFSIDIFSMGSVGSMIRKNGHYILNIDDFGKICKHFGLNPTSTKVQTFPGIDFTEYRFYDIFTNGELVSFYDHDGKFRTRKNAIDFYEDTVDNVLGKNPDMPPVGMMNAIKKNVHKTPAKIKQKIEEVKNHTVDKSD